MSVTLIVLFYTENVSYVF